MNTQTFRVFMRSRPGPYEQYDGHVDVVADDEEEAVERAFQKLRMGTFPDRSRGMWKINRVERRYR